MKGSRAFALGLCISMTLSALAATVYNYFPPPGMTYSPTAGLVIGTATGGSQGAGTVNAQGVFINGAAAVTGAGLPVGANPTGTVGLTTVNGSATTFLRSDGAPSLSQAIVPSWTGTHTFDNTTANIVLNNSGGATDTKNYLFRSSTSGIFIQSATDAAPTTPVTNAFAATRSGTAWTAVNVGNATDNPTFSFLGTGAFSVAGGVTVGSPTGGNQGTGSINMQSCFVNGVACSVGGAAGANPTGTIGLTVVNGSAGTYMRSDAAPPLSQAITPTWTGAHIFAKNAASPPSFSQSASFSATSNGVAAVFYSPTTGAAGSNIDFYDTTNALVRGYIGWGTSTITGASATDFGIAPGTGGRVLIGTPNGGAIGGIFDTNGNLQIPYIGVGRAPSSGITRIITDNGGSGDSEIVSQTTTAGNAQFRAVNLSGTNWSFGNLRSSGDWVLCPAATLTGCVLDVNQTGSQSTFTSTSSMTLKAKTNTASQNAQVEIQGASSSLGGICTSDTAAVCGTGEAANDLDFFGTGVFHFGPTTGASTSDYITASSSGMLVGGSGVSGSFQGSGSINVSTGYAVAGSFAASSIFGAHLIYGYITGNGSGCTMTNSVGASGCTRASAGRYNFTPTAGSWTGMACSASPDVGASTTSATAGATSSGSGGVQVYNGSTPADGNVSFICISK